MANQFDAPIPGQSLSKHPKGAAWNHPPKFAKLSDACNYVFDQLTQEAKTRQLVAMAKAGMPLEGIARVLIMSGFSEGLWTPDIGLLMTRPVMYMLTGITKRAGIDAKLTTTDRSGLRDLVGLKKLTMTDATPAKMEDQKPMNGSTNKLRGLLAPPGA